MRARVCRLALLFSFYTVARVLVAADQASDTLRRLKDSVTNLDEYRTQNNLQGWDDITPVCNWTFVSCSTEGDVQELDMPARKGSSRWTPARGPFPHFLSNIATLTKLDLSYNNLSGELPGSWGDNGTFPNLTFLALDAMGLTGALPPEWGNTGVFPALGYLSIHNNSLTGVLPSEWGSPGAFQGLQVLALYGNQLEGYIPNGLAYLGEYTTYLWLKPGNEEMCGPCQVSDKLVVCEQRITGSSSTVAATCKPLYTLGPQCPSGAPDFTEQDLQDEDVLPVFLELLYEEPPSYEFDEQHHDSLVMALSASVPSVAPGGVTILSPSADVTTGNAGLDALLPSGPSILAVQEFEAQLEASNRTTAVNATTPTEQGGRRRMLQEQDTSALQAIAAPVASAAAASRASRAGPAQKLQAMQRRVLVVSPPEYDHDNIDLVAATLVAVPGANAATLEAELDTAVSTGELAKRLVDGGWEGVTGVRVVTQGAFGNASSAAGAGASSDDGDSDGLSPGLLAVAIAVPIGVLVLAAAVLAGAVLLLRRGRGRQGCWNGAASTHSSSAKDALPSDGMIAVHGGGDKGSGGCEGGIDDVRRSWSGSVSSGAGGLMKLPAPGRPRDTVVVDAAFLTDCVARATFSDWQIDPGHLQLCEKPDGTVWELGRGSFSRVYKALYDGVHCVALKVLLPDAGGGLAGEFEKEVAILRRCHNRHLVQFLGACVAGDQLLLAFEFMEGGDLFKWLASDNRHAFTFKDDSTGRPGLAYSVALDVARGLHFLHTHRIVHLDLKSANILLARDATAKIGDVGLARVLGKDYVTSTAGVVGTFAWAAPEVLLGRPFSEKADIWSYGVVLWELATKEKPERGMLRNPRVPEECPQAVYELIYECMDENPRNRPSAKEVVERLQSMYSPPLEPSASTTSSLGRRPGCASSSDGGSSSSRGGGDPVMAHSPQLVADSAKAAAAEASGSRHGAVLVAPEARHGHVYSSPGQPSAVDTGPVRPEGRHGHPSSSPGRVSSSSADTAGREGAEAPWGEDADSPLAVPAAPCAGGEACLGRCRTHQPGGVELIHQEGLPLHMRPLGKSDAPAALVAAAAGPQLPTVVAAPALPAAASAHVLPLPLQQQQ